MVLLTKWFAEQQGGEHRDRPRRSNSHRASNLENSLQAFFFENPLKSVEAGRPCRRTLEQIWAICTFSIIRDVKELAGQSPIDFITQKVSHPRFLD